MGQFASKPRRLLTTKFLSNVTVSSEPEQRENFIDSSARTHSMLQLLIQNISEVVVVIDPSGVIHFSNPQLEKVLGLRTEDVVGRNIFDFIHPDDSRRAALEYSETVGRPGEG